MQAPDDFHFLEIQQKIDYFGQKKYGQYEPTVGPFPNFFQRLDKWIDNTPDEADQKSLAGILPHIFFIGREEFDALYRVAFKRELSKWLVDIVNIDPFALDAEQVMQNALSRTWICPLTDSLRINGFYHINHISGREIRPDWRTLAHIGTNNPKFCEGLCDYISNSGIDRLVLIEDFVGCGSQMAETVTFAATLLNIPILIIPLVICPNGESTATVLKTKFPNTTFSPVISLPQNIFVAQVATAGEESAFAGVREFIARMHSYVKGNTYPLDKDYGPFGFADTGGLVVMYTNCPDNTLPVIHYNTDTWCALFPRASRI